MNQPLLNPHLVLHPLKYVPRSRNATRDTYDELIPRNNGKAKSERIALGLELMSMSAKRGVEYTPTEIAAWCGCSDSAIQDIERTALRKLTQKLTHIKDKL